MIQEDHSISGFKTLNYIQDKAAASLKPLLALLDIGRFSGR